MPTTYIYIYMAKKTFENYVNDIVIFLFTVQDHCPENGLFIIT